MTSADGVPIALHAESLPSELPDRRQHVEPDARREVAAAHEAVVDERREPVEGIEVIGGADDLGCLRRPPAGEARQVSEEPAERSVEQIVAPGDGVAERPLARRQVAGTLRERRDAVPEPFEDGLG